MSTILRLTGAAFDNPALPIITPLVSDGLVGAFRPYRSLARTIDLSGNGRRLTLKGSPLFSDFGVIGSSSSGLITDIFETASMTITTVSRMCLDGVLLSDYSGGLAAGYYAVDPAGGGDAKRGTATMWIPNPGTPAGTHNLRAFGLTHARRNSDNLQLIISNGGVSEANVDPAGRTHSLPEFVAVTVSAVTNKRIVYIPRLGIVSEYDGNTNAVPASFANRRLVSPANGTPNRMHIATLPEGSGYTGTGRIEVGEALFYNRALSADEVARQYALSSDFFAKHRGWAI